MSDLLAYIPIAVAVAGAIALLLTALSRWERSRGHTDLADKLDVAEETLSVFSQVLSGHEHGLTIVDAALAVEKSPEAQDLIAKMKAKALELKAGPTPAPQNGASS